MGKEALNTDRAERDAWIDRAAPILSAVAWTVPLIVISIGLLRRPGQRSLDPIYRWATETWAVRGPLYTDAEGFIYLPTFVPIYVPFAWLPTPLGEILWRAVAVAGIAHGLWSMMALAARPRSARGFLLLSIACLPVSLGALQMGQANAWIAMALIQAAAAIGRERLWSAAAWLALGLAIKPIVVAAMGLAFLRNPRIAIPAAVFTLAWAALPYLTAPTPYVTEQYAMAWRTITESCASVTEHRFADLNGLLRSYGADMPSTWSNATSAASGLVLAALTLVWGRRHDARSWSAIWLAMSCCYLLLFNPMTEANSYCMISVPAALAAWALLGRGEDPSNPNRLPLLLAGWACIGTLLLMGIGSEVARPWLGNSLDLWFFPLCALGLIGATLHRLVASGH
jgi:hypothetical protein